MSAFSIGPNKTKSPAHITCTMFAPMSQTVNAVLLPAFLYSLNQSHADLIIKITILNYTELILLIFICIFL